MIFLNGDLWLFLWLCFLLQNFSSNQSYKQRLLSCSRQSQREKSALCSQPRRKNICPKSYLSLECQIHERSSVHRTGHMYKVWDPVVMRSCIPCSATICMQHPIPSVSDLKAPQISVSRNMVLVHQNSLRKLYLLDLLKSYLAWFKRLGFSVLSTPPLKKEQHHTPIPTPIFLKIWLGDNSFLY